MRVHLEIPAYAGMTMGPRVGLSGYVPDLDYCSLRLR